MRLTTFVLLQSAIIFSTAVYIGAGQTSTSGPNIAQSQPARIRWSDIAALAKKQNLETISARKAVQISEQKYRASQSGFYPQLTGLGSFNKSNTATSLDSLASGSRSSTQDEYVLSMSLQQSLFSGFKTQAQMQNAKLTWEKSKAALEIQEAKSAYDLRAAFIKLYIAQENVELLKSIAKRRRDNEQLIALRYQAGRENRGAGLRVKAQTAQAQFEVERAIRAKNLSRSNLGRVLGDFNTLSGLLNSSSVLESEISEKYSLLPTPDFEVLLQKTPTYRSYEIAKNIAQAETKSARGAFFPEWSMSATGRKRGSTFFPENESWNVGTSLSLPIFSGGSNRYNLRQALESEKKADIDLRAQKMSLATQLQEAYYALLDAEQFLDVEIQYLAAAEERAAIARAQYTTGLISFQDWDLIETDLINTQKQKLQAYSDVKLAEAFWFQTLGKGFDN